MSDLLNRVWENLLERTEGPMNLRFFLQPAMSLFFAIKAAIRDSKNGTVPFRLGILFLKEQRKNIAKEGWKDVGKLFIIGSVLDIIYQLVVIFGLKTQQEFYPLESLLVAFLLAIVPYLLFRGPVNRLISLFTRKKNSEKNVEM